MRCKILEGDARVAEPWGCWGCWVAAFMRGYSSVGWVPLSCMSNRHRAEMLVVTYDLAKHYRALCTQAP